jgi:acyl-CoA synthetase (AMP-forming)/AMP-acid ligase II
MSRRIAENGNKLFPNGQVCEVYGSTETGSIALCCPVNKSGATGKVFKNVEIKIIDENCAKLGPMERGEICVRSRSVCLVMFNHFSIVFPLILRLI